jgi:DNA-binding HxlR family transcriptional regulator
MKNKTIEPDEPSEPLRAAADAAECTGTRPLEQFHAAMRILTGKWKGEILWTLVRGKLRFGELRRAIPGMTQHMLTTQLRDLERHRLVKRTIYPEVPPRVEYELTPSAQALRPVFEEIGRWVEEHASELKLAADESGQHDDSARTHPGRGDAL